MFARRKYLRPLHEYVRSELAAAPNVHTAVLVLE